MRGRSGTSNGAAPNLWALILAGEDGEALDVASSAFETEDRRAAGEASGVSLLRQTLDCARLAVPESRIVVVASRGHEVDLTPDFPAPERHAPRLVLRPPGRGTATDVLLAVHWIRRQQADATIVILPSEQVVREPRALMQHVVAVAEFVDRHAREIVLVGSPASDPASGYGWMETSEPIPDPGTTSVWRIRSLRGSAPPARSGGRSGWLRNTAVIVGRAEALIQAGRLHLPELDARLETATTLVGTRYERRSLEECYAAARDARFGDVIRGGGNRLLSASSLPARGGMAAIVGRAGRPPAPRGRFDGLVEQYDLADNVEACLATTTMSRGSPWKASPWRQAERKRSRGLEI
jgi:mannose-1-phosphate guanylyltransferase